MDSIFKRRSIRKYTGEIVPQELIEKIIKAGMSAPSAGDEQPWHFIVLDQREIINKIPEFHPYSQMLKYVNHAIVVCAELSLQKHDGFWVQDCSAAVENMLITAAELGLGSVWLGVYPREERVTGMKKLLKLPEDVIPLCVLPIGYPDETKEPADRFHAERIHYNQW